MGQLRELGPGSPILILLGLAPTEETAQLLCPLPDHLAQKVFSHMQSESPWLPSMPTAFFSPVVPYPEDRPYLGQISYHLTEGPGSYCQYPKGLPFLRQGKASYGTRCSSANSCFCELKTGSSSLQGLWQNFVIEFSTESSILFSLRSSCFHQYPFINREEMASLYLCSLDPNYTKQIATGSKCAVITDEKNRCFLGDLKNIKEYI